MKSSVNIVVDDDDVPYEEDILRNQFSVKAWLRYIDFKKEAPKNAINLLFERALKELPGSYILWHRYLKLRRAQVRGLCVLDPAVEDVNSAFERALVFMHKMPRIWLDYCEFIMAQCNITRTRDVFDRSLRALPITQHHRIWPLYLKFVTAKAPPETAVRVYRRYLKLCYEDTEDFIDYLTDIDRLDEASIKLAEVVNNERFVSKHGKPKHQLWNELCELISKNPEKVKSLNVDAIIRDGLRRFSDQVGHFWNCLADYYIRSGLFDRARDIYEEAINTVMTVRDFTQVFDAYSQCEESLIKVKMEEIENGAVAAENVLHLDLLMERYDYLLERRPLLLNSVLLRQNPHNVHEWHRRIKLLEGKPKEIISTYTEAVQKVDPKLACGKLHTLWVSFAKFYESHKQIDDARIIFEKAIQVSYTEVDDLASVWCEWAEMEIRHNNFETALKLMHRATAAPVHKGSYHDQSLPVQERLYKSLKVWLLYADLEEALGKFKSIKAVYDRIIDLRIATPQVIINYGLFLEENNYFEEAFKAYEKGISLFKWPNVYDIWNTYLVKFLKRYGGTKLERARDLFEQCLERCPAEFAKSIYLLYAKLEEEHGLARHAMSVYERATRAVLPKEQFEMFNIYLKKAAEIYGVTYTRQIYEKAIELLPDNEAKQMCLKFADLEKKLGEIDRSRAIYAHCSQMCDPRKIQVSLREGIKCDVSNLDGHKNDILERVSATKKIIKDSKQVLQKDNQLVSKEILQRDLAIEKFISEELEKDVPTGTTPQRKTYYYSKELITLSPDDEKLHTLRQFWGEHTDKAVNLPMDCSFDEEDVFRSPLNQEVCELTKGNSAESVHNTSFNNGDDYFTDCETLSNASSTSDLSVTGLKNKENFKTFQKPSLNRLKVKKTKKKLTESSIPTPTQRKPLSSKKSINICLKC